MEPDEVDVEAVTSALRDGIERAKELMRETSEGLLDHCGQEMAIAGAGASPAA
jgi:hypothetical protein